MAFDDRPGMDLDQGARFVMRLKHGATISRAGARAFAVCKTGTEPVTGMVQKLRKTALFPTQLISDIRLGVVSSVTVRTAAENPVITGFHVVSRLWRNNCQPQLQKLSHGSRTGRHPMLEPEIVDCRQFLRSQHDL